MPHLLSQPKSRNLALLHPLRPARIGSKLRHGKTAAGAASADLIFKGRQFTAEVILWAVRWYLMFPISYRDLELMLLDRGVEVSYTTVFRWIQAYAPELEKRLRSHRTGAAARGVSTRPTSV